MRHVCPDCQNTFMQPFRCTTCGAQKLYDETLRVALAEADILRQERDWYREALHRMNAPAARAVVGEK